MTAEEYLLEKNKADYYRLSSSWGEDIIYHKQFISEMMEEWAELKVKNLAQPDVSGQRELLASAGYEYAFSTKGIDENGVPYIDERFTLANSH